MASVLRPLSSVPAIMKQHHVTSTLREPPLPPQRISTRAARIDPLQTNEAHFPG